MVSQIKADLGFIQIVIGHSIVTLPFVVRNCTAALKGVSPTLEEAAQTLGASAVRSFFEVVLPLMRSGILAGAIIAFVLSFNEFTISYFLYTVDIQPFSIWLFTRSNTSLDPTIFAVSSIIILFNAGMILLLDRIVGRQGLSM
jgi:putative spermidine/putrescine transport system permease protein